MLVVLFLALVIALSIPILYVREPVFKLTATAAAIALAIALAAHARAAPGAAPHAAASQHLLAPALGPLRR